MTTSSKCDEILVLDRGKVQIKGTHEQLLSQKRILCKDFWQVQVGRP